MVRKCQNWEPYIENSDCCSAGTVYTWVISWKVTNRDVKIVFFLKIDYRLLKIDFFSIIVSDVTVTVGCSNMLGCREGWCSCRGGWWRGRTTNRLDTQTEQTASRTHALVRSVTCQWNIQSATESGGGRETAACSKQHRLKRYLLDGGGGERGEPASCQQTICNHTDLPVGLLGKPVGQATAHNAGGRLWSVNWGQGFHLNYQQG